MLEALIGSLMLVLVAVLPVGLRYKGRLKFLIAAYGARVEISIDGTEKTEELEVKSSVLTSTTTEH